jgi:hypothetical protein
MPSKASLPSALVEAPAQSIDSGKQSRWGADATNHWAMYIFEDQRSLLLIWGRKEKVFLHTCLKNSKNTEFHINTA